MKWILPICLSFVPFAFAEDGGLPKGFTLIEAKDIHKSCNDFGTGANPCAVGRSGKGAIQLVRAVDAFRTESGCPAKSEEEEWDEADETAQQKASRAELCRSRAVKQGSFGSNIEGAYVVVETGWSDLNLPLQGGSSQIALKTAWICVEKEGKQYAVVTDQQAKIQRSFKKDKSCSNCSPGCPRQAVSTEQFQLLKEAAERAQINAHQTGADGAATRDVKPK